MAWSRQKRHARIVRLKRARIRGYDPESPPRAAGAGADPHLGLRYALAELTIRGAEDAALRRAVIRSAGSQAVHTRDYRGSGEYSTMRRSEGFATIEIAFSVGGSPSRIGGNPHWSFVFSLCDQCTGTLCSHASVLSCRNTFPFVGRLGVADWAVSEPKQIGAPPLGIASAALFCDLDKSEGTNFPHRRSDGVAIDAVFRKVVKGDGQLSVIVAPVVGQLDFNASKQTVGGETQDLIGRRLHHCDGARGKLPVDAVLAAASSGVAHRLSTGRAPALAKAALRLGERFDGIVERAIPPAALKSEARKRYLEFMTPCPARPRRPGGKRARAHDEITDVVA
jgi:hypothetical protein